MAAQPLAASVKPPLHIKVGDHKVDFHSGCSVIDVTFPNVFYVEIGEIHFKNYYTAWLSVQARCKDQATNGDGSKWKTCVRHFPLMPDPHADQGAEDYFTITQKHLGSPLQNVVRLRFILRQPSPIWREFRIDDIRMYKTSINVAPQLPLPLWVTKHNEKDEEKPHEIKGLGSIESLSGLMQQMWAMTEQVKAGQPTTQLGRYDVNGSYEINLLSYT